MYVGMYFPLTSIMEVNTVLYGIVSVGRYCNSVSVKVAIKAHRNCIIFSSNLPEHTTVMGRLLAETTVLVSGVQETNTHDFTILTVVKIKEQ